MKFKKNNKIDKILKRITIKYINYKNTDINKNLYQYFFKRYMEQKIKF